MYVWSMSFLSFLFKMIPSTNHNIIGGLGSAVAEVLSGNYPVPLERIGVHDTFGEVGDVGYLKKRFQMTPDDIVRAALRAINRKNQLIFLDRLHCRE